MNEYQGKGNGYVDPATIDFNNPQAMDAWRSGNGNIPGYNSGNGQPYNQNGQQQQQRVKPKIDITPAPFDGENKTKTMKSIELCGIISDVFGTIFVDFEGCIIERNPQTNQPILKMFFVQNKMDANEARKLKKLVALEPVFKPNNRTQPVSPYFQQAASRMGGRRYNLSLDAQDILEPLIYHRKGTRVNWGRYTQEIAPDYNYNPSNYIITVQVAGFDMLKVLEFVYGTSVTDDDGNVQNVTYGMNIIRNLTPPPTMNWAAKRFNTEFLISIQQLNLARLNSLAAELGMGNVGCQLTMVKPRI